VTTIKPLRLSVFTSGNQFVRELNSHPTSPDKLCRSAVPSLSGRSGAIQQLGHLGSVGDFHLVARKRIECPFIAPQRSGVASVPGQQLL
jgi:hypothetical protein